MNIPWRTIIWQQFGAAIDTLDDMLRACPEELWRERLWVSPSAPPEIAEFWYRVYHALFWLDLYLTGTEEGFVPPATFTLIEQDEAGPVPERPYTKEELQAYLNHCRKRCQVTIETMTDEAALRRCRFGWGEVSFAELLLYNMRHVQEIAAQLSLILGQNGVAVLDSVPTARTSAA
ncbi:MAG TPA: DinB family protein [Anaerolineales bacterium]|nr:DinB family protein [Anaerolineales bacterium]